jgi:hypothetical protein
VITLILSYLGHNFFSFRQKKNSEAATGAEQATNDNNTDDSILTDTDKKEGE